MLTSSGNPDIELKNPNLSSQITKAAEVALQGGKDRLIRKRETYEDQVRLELEYLEK